MGGFKFQESHIKMVKLSVSLGGDDILYNRTNVEIMENSLLQHMIFQTVQVD
jgi:hypothetical protein